MTRVYRPVHADTALNDEWWRERGYTVGNNLWYNAIRDGSGRYDGYCVDCPDGQHTYVNTVAEAEAAINRDLGTCPPL